MVRSIKSTFAPINQIPSEAISLIPGYCDTDELLIALTHVCHDWGEHVISHISSWSRLDYTNVDKTRVYTEGSKTSPLEICLEMNVLTSSDAFLLTVPHLG